MNDTRERLVTAAYALFTERGIGRSGVDLIANKANCAKASLYSIFGSKNQLAIAVLQRREELWTRNWLEAEIKQRASEPQEQLLAIFDLFDEWFRRKDFEGCPFIKLMLESRAEDDVRTAATKHLANVRSIIAEVAGQARLKDPKTFAEIWHILMKGAIVAAEEGDQNAALNAQKTAKGLLKNWPKS